MLLNLGADAHVPSRCGAFDDYTVIDRRQVFLFELAVHNRTDDLNYLSNRFHRASP
jgi:hypothetical protein